MFDVIVVGAGLCGLVVSHLLQRRGLSCCVLEARGRAGGRILTRHGRRGTALDVGPMWVWPEQNPNVTRLLELLDIETVEQFAAGDSLFQSPPSVEVSRLQYRNPHAGAMRVRGGMDLLAHALAGRLQNGSLRLHHVVKRVLHQGDHVEVEVWRGDDQVEMLSAQRVIMAVPPRLVLKHVRFEPALDAALFEKMNDTATWMATNAKALVEFETPTWRKQGLSGSAFIPLGILSETFDASGAAAGALGGFFGLDAGQRDVRRSQLSGMVLDQLNGLFGVGQDPSSTGRGGEDDVVICDWATEDFTATTRDLAHPAGQPAAADPLVRLPHWYGRLLFGASETATRNPGHLEGAVERALQLEAMVMAPLPRLRHMAGKEKVSTDTPPESGNWTERVNSRLATAKGIYRQELQRALTVGATAEVTQLAVTCAAKAVYDELLSEWQEATSKAHDNGPGMEALGEWRASVFAGLVGFHEELIAAAIRFNRSSCALRNFPAEFDPSAAYVHQMWRALVSDYEHFWAQLDGATFERARA